MIRIQQSICICISLYKKVKQIALTLLPYINCYLSISERFKENKCTGNQRKIINKYDMKLIIGYIRGNHNRSMIFVLLCCSEKPILGNHVLVQKIFGGLVYIWNLILTVKPTSIYIRCRFFFIRNKHCS